MQPVVEHVPRQEEVSFRYLDYTKPAFPFEWHIHPELELTLITAGHGQRYVGDHMAEFDEGDLVLLGENVPHTWHSQRQRGACSSAVVIQFRRDFLGPSLFEHSELRAVGQMLDRAALGIAFSGADAQSVAQRMVTLPQQPPVYRSTELLRMLDDLTRCRDAPTLSSRPMDNELRAEDQRRIDAACKLIHRGYRDALSQAEVADLLHMSPSAFARFFKRMTGQTFVDYLHRLRIGQACRLLIETDRPITEICFDTGFGNMSNFNRIFRRLKGTNPRAYRKRFTTAAHASAAAPAPGAPAGPR